MKRALLPVAVLALCAPSASAHVLRTGLGPFHDGVAHVALTPEDLLPALALALWAGLGGRECGRRALLVLPLAWLAGGFAGIAWPAPAPHPAAFALSALVAGLLLAFDVARTPRSVALLATAFGLAHGFVGGSDLAGASRPLLTASGSAVAILASTALCAALAASIARPWKRVAVRVAGSWIAAVGLLMGAWALR